MEDKFTDYYEGWVSAAKDYMGMDEAEARAVVDRVVNGLMRKTKISSGDAASFGDLPRVVNEFLREMDIKVYDKIRDLAGVR